MPNYNNARYQGGGGKPKRQPGTVASELKSGDFAVLVSNKVSKASELSDSGTKAQNQEAGHDVFLGVVVDGKLADQTKDVLVQADGEFRYPCTALSQAYDIGQFFGMAGTGSGGAVGLADQSVEPVATANLAIGKLSRYAASGATEVYIEIKAAVTTPGGGTQAAA